MLDIELLWSQIKDYDVVSFDIFDTLIKRNVSMPKGIFDIVQRTYNNYHENKITDFYRQRLYAEKIAIHRFNKLSVTLDEIYSVIKLPNEVKSELLQLEIETEVKYCKPNYNIKQLYDRVVIAGKKIIITSDMYLSSSILKMILENSGYAGFSKIYVSCEHNATKRRIKLFKVVLEDMKGLTKEIVHIGDDLVGDYIMPRFCGISSVYIQKRTDSTLILTNKEIYKLPNVLYMFLNNMLGKYTDRNIAFRIGYETLGPILYGYTEWIHKQIVDSDIEHAYFLARDMYLFHDVYKKRYGEKKISYLEVSRRSLRKAYIVAKGNPIFCRDTMANKKHEDVDFARALDISVENWMQIKENGDTADFAFDADLTKKYLQQEGLFENKKIAIVDIGWRGTGQHALETIIERPIKGLYWQVCHREDFSRMDVLGCCGCWYSPKNAKPEILGTAGLLESLLFPRVGTTVGYKQVGDRIVPIHTDCEMENTEKIGELQRGAMQFVDDCIAEKISFGKDNFSLPFLNMAQHPNKQIVEFFKSWRFEDNMVYTTICLRSRNEYLKNPKLFLKDFHVCFWKEGFLAQVLPGFVNPSWFTRVIRRVIWATKGMP